MFLFLILMKTSYKSSIVMRNANIYSSPCQLSHSILSYCRTQEFISTCTSVNKVFNDVFDNTRKIFKHKLALFIKDLMNCELYGIKSAFHSCSGGPKASPFKKLKRIEVNVIIHQRTAMSTTHPL